MEAIIDIWLFVVGGLLGIGLCVIALGAVMGHVWKKDEEAE